MASVIHASIDERGSARGGEAGDQSGKEVCLASFNPNRGWNKVLRCTDQKIAKKMIKKGKKLCSSNLVGYDQNQRNTLHSQLVACAYSISAYIRTGVKTETDCSAFMTAIALAAGVTGLEYPTSGNAPTTRTMVDAFTKTGLFQAIPYTTGMTLYPSDILVKEGSHTAMYIGE